MDELTPEQKFAAEDPESIALIERVMDDLRNYHGTPEERMRLVAAARRQFAAGFLIALIGIMASAFSILAALSGLLPIAVVSVGLIFGGFAPASPGWSRWRLYRRDRLPFDDPPDGDLLE